MLRTDKVENADLRTVLYARAAAAGIPLSGSFELTPLCNFNCSMCYVHMTQEQMHAHSGKMMRLNEWVHLAEEAKRQGMLYVLLTGGEPLLWPDFWKLYDALYRMRFLISINTNGSLITDEIIQRFTEQPPYRINITLYGASDETYQRLCGVKGMYDRVVHAVEGLQDAGLMVKLNCSATPDNASDLQQILAYADDRGLTLVPTVYMFPPVRRNLNMVGRNARFTPEEAAAVRMRLLQYRLGEENYIQYLKSVLAGLPAPLGLGNDCEVMASGKIQCAAGRASFWATWNGHLSMCGMIPDERLSLRELSFEQAWKQVRDSTRSVQLSGTCAECGSQSVCNACAAKALAETGNFSGIPRYFCEMVQEMKNIAERELSKNSKKQ